MAKDSLQAVIVTAQEILGEEYSLQVKEIVKENRTLTGVEVCKKGSNIGPTVYAENLPEEPAAAVEELVRIAKLPLPEISLPEFMTKENIFPFAVNTGRNMKILKECLSRQIGGDISVIYRYVAPASGESTDGDGVMSARITRSLAAAAELTEEELYEISKENLMREGGYSLMSMRECVSALMGPDAVDELPEEVLLDAPMYVVKGRGESAAAVFFEPVARMVSERLGGDFYILPSSRMEVICVPTEGADPEMLRGMVYEINRTELREEDYLSDTVYKYSVAEGYSQCGCYEEGDYY